MDHCENKQSIILFVCGNHAERYDTFLKLSRKVVAIIKTRTIGNLQKSYLLLSLEEHKHAAYAKKEYNCPVSYGKKQRILLKSDV